MIKKYKIVKGTKDLKIKVGEEDELAFELVKGDKKKCLTTKR